MMNFDSIEQLALLCYQILPGFDTILHRLSNNGEAIRRIFEIAQPNEERLNEILVHIPFLPNPLLGRGFSPMHICK
jgi:hypothetical protein